MSSIRILLRTKNDLRKRVDEIGLTSAPGVKLVGEMRNVMDVLLAIKRGQADVVVITTGAEDRGVASHLLGQFPDMTVLILGRDGEAYIEQRCHHRRSFRGKTGLEIASALRFAVENPCQMDAAEVG